MASKGLGVSVGFEIDTTAYAGKNAAKEGVNYRLKNTSNTLSFTDGGEMVAYLSIEPIDNGTYDGDVCFDIKLSAPEGCNLGANYTTTVTISDDDHPLAAAGILGTYNVVGQTPFSNVPGPFYWTCVVSKDNDYENRVWFTQVTPDLQGLTPKPVMGTVSDDFNTITIQSGQSLGTVGSYVFSLNILSMSSGQPVLSTTASVVPGTSINISEACCVSEANGDLYAGAHTIVMTKVQE